MNKGIVIDGPSPYDGARLMSHEEAMACDGIAGGVSFVVTHLTDDQSS